MTCTPDHCRYCFDVLSAKLNKADPPTSVNLPSSDKDFPLFVTWNMKASSAAWSSANLRGCIGNFSPMPLEKGLRDYALISALKDSRFNPITLSELPRLECGVSLLTDFETCSSPYDWELGRHGIHVYLPTSSGELSATFLPDVAAAQGWDQTDTLKHAIKKSGFRGKVDDKVIGSLRVERYQSSKATMNYDEWKAGQ